MTRRTAGQPLQATQGPGVALEVDILVEDTQTVQKAAHYLALGRPTRPVDDDWYAGRSQAAPVGESTVANCCTIMSWLPPNVPGTEVE
jgi:hypothetical protein